MTQVAQQPASRQIANGEAPEGWTSAPIADVTVDVPSIKPEDEPEREFHYVDISAICNRTFRITETKTFLGKDAPSRARRPIQAGDVLFSNVRTYLRNIAKVEAGVRADVCSTGFTVLRANAAVDPSYLFLSVLTDEFIDSVSETQTGTHYPATSDRQVRAARIPLPPLAEQKWIVARVAELSAHVDAARERLAKGPVILKRLRQAVLAAACSGRLTEDWREQHPVLKPASQLVREHRFQLAILPDELPEIPDSWAWVPLGNYGRCSRGRFLVRPRNDPRYFDGPYPFIQIGNPPPDGGWITSHTQTLNDRGLAVSKMFPKGTVAIAIVGATIGNTGLLGYDMCFTDSMVGIETGTIEGNQFVELFLRHRKQAIREASYSSGGQPNIKLEVLNPYPLALPPLDEQAEIVRRVEALFKLAEAIERRVATAAARADKLIQSILARAFRGELVPTEAELARREGRGYESAEQLLTRVRAACLPVKPRRGTRSITASAGDTITFREEWRVAVKRKLINVLREAKGRMTPEELFRRAGCGQDDIDMFYEQLREGLESGQITQIPENPDPRNPVVYLEACTR
jgi:type I restriction enzyme S subunit